jgi:hypothetical protein
MVTGSSSYFRQFHASHPFWEKLNLEGLAKKVDLSGKNVLVRVDLNVPLAQVQNLSDHNGFSHWIRSF